MCVCVCVCVYLNCFAIQHKLTQHWKSTIILFKKNPKHIHIQNPNIYTHTGCGTHTQDVGHTHTHTHTHTDKSLPTGSDTFF